MVLVRYCARERVEDTVGAPLFSHLLGLLSLAGRLGLQSGVFDELGLESARGLLLLQPSLLRTVCLEPGLCLVGLLHGTQVRLLLLATLQE